MSSDCFACAVNDGRIRPPGGTIYDDGLWVADHGVDRLVRGYVVLKPKRHVHHAADLNEEEGATMGTAMQLVTAAMRDALHPERIYACSFAETVHHLHFHLLPRYAHMPGLGPKLMEQLFAERWGCTPEEAESAAAAIREAVRRP